MVKALIFDLWGTVIENGVHPSPARQVKYFLRVRYPFSEFIVPFEASFMKKKHESLQAGFESVVKDFNLKIPSFVYEKLVGTWNKNAILAKIYPEVDEVLKSLKEEGYKLFLLSNVDQFSFEQVKSKFNLDEYFDKVYASCETGLLKTDKEAFEMVLKENKLKAKDVVMIGDSVESDINGAAKADIKGILVDRRDSREFEGKIITLAELPAKLKEM